MTTLDMVLWCEEVILTHVRLKFLRNKSLIFSTKRKRFKF